MRKKISLIIWFIYDRKSYLEYVSNKCRAAERKKQHPIDHRLPLHLLLIGQREDVENFGKNNSI